MNTCTRHIQFAKQSTVALALWVSICSICCKLTFQNDMDWNYIPSFLDFQGDFVASVSFETKFQ